MLVRVDWLSFTIKGSVWNEARTGTMAEQTFAQIGVVAKRLRAMMEGEGTWVEGSGRAPFKFSLRNPEIGCMIFFGHQSNLVLVEFSGVGCETLRRLNGENYILKLRQVKFTRIDIAVDYLSPIRPPEFAEARTNQRFKSGGHRYEQSGETVYVGSEKSDRFARVYRYEPPHPRSAFLRCEMVSRDEQAAEVVNAIRHDGLESAAKQLGNAFGWTHDLWLSEENEEEALKAWRPNDRGGGTVTWLYKQVLPAVERLLEEGQQQTVNEFVAKLAALCYDYSQ